MLTHTLGFPRIGTNRELKNALESFWEGRTTEADLTLAARTLRLQNWELQEKEGIDLLPVGDFSLYDHVLDTIVMLGAAPIRYQPAGVAPVDLPTYFRMARGESGSGSRGAMEMSKWFDTNYHYIVPELAPEQEYRPNCSGLLAQVDEAATAGFRTKVTILGPLTFLRIGKSVVEDHHPLDRIDPLIEAYEQILRQLAPRTEWIQLDEPILVLDMSPQERSLISYALDRLLRAASPSKVMLATYFGALGDNVEVACRPGLSALHLDLATAPHQLADVISNLPGETALSLGLVDGRNVWKVDTPMALGHVEQAVRALGADRVMLGASCSLLHVPIDLERELGVDPEVRSRLAFAVQKCRELRILANLAVREASQTTRDGNREAGSEGHTPGEAVDPKVRARCEAITPEMLSRNSIYAERRVRQQALLNLPVLPTTTIGSFPQTHEIREARAAYRSGSISPAEYEQTMRNVIGNVIDCQHHLGLDVLVHGEPERNDMVQYFAEQLAGFCVTEHGWVQSYGSRCIKPPIIHDDVSRPEPMTAPWITFAQSLTDKPLKGMLTGPVTMLHWSFVRDDLPLREVCNQLALAIRDEVQDLEAAGIRVVQVDEPALREGLPLRSDEWDSYLDWAIDAFRLATSGVRDKTQIHTHMCYGDFNDIAQWIAKMDADVISMEASRSNMELLRAFRGFGYPNDIGPGVWDIHSPRVPSVEEIADLLRLALKVIPAERLWVNPDCGLKTRAWPETIASLQNMVAAAVLARNEIAATD